MRLLTPSAVFAVSFATILVVLPGADAQQYAGSNITNSLPAVTGSAISFFKVNDIRGSTTLMNYFSAPNGARQDASKVQRAIIVLHGANRDPCKPLELSMLWDLLRVTCHK